MKFVDKFGIKDSIKTSSGDYYYCSLEKLAESTIEQVKQYSGIVEGIQRYVPLKKRGRVRKILIFKKMYVAFHFFFIHQSFHKNVVFVEMHVFVETL